MTEPGEAVKMEFKQKYGPWAFVAGGSDGIGGAYSDYLAKKGVGVVVVGRKAETVDTKCRQLEGNWHVQTRALPLDVADDELVAKVEAATRDLDIGILVYNAGLADLRRYETRDMDTEIYRVKVNVVGMLKLTLYFSRLMVPRRRGGMILMSSNAGVTGSPYVATYSATKAYGLALAESLWCEMSEYGIDVLGVMPGATIGTQFRDVPPGTPGYMTAKEVVEEAFENLGEVPSFLVGEAHRTQFKDVYNQGARIKNMMMQRNIMLEHIRAMETGTVARVANQ